jgi:hypothetical protein
MIVITEKTVFVLKQEHDEDVLDRIRIFETLNTYIGRWNLTDTQLVDYHEAITKLLTQPELLQGIEKWLTLEDPDALHARIAELFAPKAVPKVVTNAS